MHTVLQPLLYLLWYGVFCSCTYRPTIMQSRVSLHRIHCSSYFGLLPLLSTQSSYDEVPCHFSPPSASFSLPLAAKIVTEGWGCGQEVFCQVLWESQLDSVPITIKQLPLLLFSGGRVQYHRKKNYLIRENLTLCSKETQSYNNSLLKWTPLQYVTKNSKSKNRHDIQLLSH